MSMLDMWSTYQFQWKGKTIQVTKETSEIAKLKKYDFWDWLIEKHSTKQTITLTNKDIVENGFRMFSSKTDSM